VHVAVSFNAATPEVYRQVHRGAKAGDYERILECLRAFVAAAAREGGEGSFVPAAGRVRRLGRTQWHEPEPPIAHRYAFPSFL